MNHPKSGPVLAKKYLTLRFNLGGQPGATLAQKYQCEQCSVLIVKPDGEVGGRLLDKPKGEQVAELIVGLPEVDLGLEQLAQLKAKGITKANAESAAAALKRIGTLPSKDGREAILEFAKDDKAPVALQRGAIMALAKQPEAASDLVPYLTDKRFPIKSAAQTTLQNMGMKALPALLDGLESDSADNRVAAFWPAMTIAKNGKVAKDMTFWKSGKPTERAKALNDWKSWAEDQLKPKSKDDKPLKK